MLPIRALNEDPDESCSSYEFEPKVTGEAEEAIIVSEYLRALQFLRCNQQENALQLFIELLETEVLNNVSNDIKDNKLLLVKYNCYRNIGLLYQERENYNLALDYLIRAVELCQNDVHTMYILAQQALKIGQIPIAKAYYEKCIERNSKHWPSLDGMLQLYLLSGNVNEACCWAIHCLKKNHNYKRAVNVLYEINNRFASSIPFIEELLQQKLPIDTNSANTCLLPKNSNFNICCGSQPTSENRNNDKIDIHWEQFQFNEFNWITLAQWIIKLYLHFESTGQVLHHFKFNKLLVSETGIDQLDNNVDEQLVTPEIDPLPESTIIRSTKNTDSSIDMETKGRRRGSELKILEQWGWHKSRRSSRKKSTYENSDPVESTADEFLKRVLGQYFVKSYDETQSPFSDQSYGHKNVNDIIKKCTSPTSTKNFTKLSKAHFDEMVTCIERREVDMFLLTYIYLQNLSLFWNVSMPQELRSLYIEIYDIFAKFINFQSWNQLSNEEITNLFRIALYYLELSHEYNKSKSPNLNEYDDNGSCRNIGDGLQFYVSYLADDVFTTYYTRYLWYSYEILMDGNCIDGALEKLTKIYSLLDTLPDTFEVYLPNKQNNNFFQKRTIHGIIESLQRQKNLICVKTLYAENKYETLIDILKDSLENRTDEQSSSVQTLSVSTQIQILLECFWQLEKYEDCMIWAEKSLKYTVDIFVSLQHLPYRQKTWSKVINFSLLYIQSLIEKEGDCIMTIEFMPRMVQTIHKILNNQLDSHFDKNLSNQYTIDCWRAWVILYYILERQDDQHMLLRKNRGVNKEVSLHEIEEESLFSSIMLFFVAHELLGRRQWCSKGDNKLLLKMLDVVVPRLRSPMFEPYRDVISECLEQTTFCLFGYPPKKGRTRHLQDHESTPETLTWDRAIQIFDMYRPDVLPEFNSYKIDSISADMEALLQQILLLMPEDCDVSYFVDPIMNFINGKADTISTDIRKNILCFKIKPIYYFLADFYFKSRDFSKAIKYYALDLTVEPARFDSWAGISLSKASKCETLLNSAESLSCTTFLNETENTMRCFKQSLILNGRDFQLWVEYGSFAYNISSYCARIIKSEEGACSRLSYLETQQLHYMNIAHKSFERVNSESSDDQKEEHDFKSSNEDEKWLYHYMLGKISEKRKEAPMTYLTHYLKAAKFLYECNATYPIKVNHSNPSQLSIEALELFYRTNAAIIKYTEKHATIGKHEAGLFKKILKELAVSPFAVNRAKINDVTLKRKIVGCSEKIQNPNSAKNENIENIPRFETKSTITNDDDTYEIKHNTTENLLSIQGCVENLEFSTRRISQESIPATNTTTTTTSNTTSSSGTDSPSTDSDSDSSTDDEDSASSADRDSIFKDCIKNLEECVTRFPEHYKSIYRLAYHYMNAPGTTKSIEKCSQLLLGSYKTALGNQIPGLFTERRSNNFFNGIWRIPSPDIDRPGSFSSHLSKCVTILIEILKLKLDHEMLLELAIQLNRRPDTDKEYLNDCDRAKLSQQAVLTCIQIYQTTFKKLNDEKKDGEILTLLVDIFKAYRKCAKNMPQKELLFVDVMKQAYRIYVQDKVKLPETANIFDLSIKLCTYEINYRKSIEKISGKQMDKASKIITTNMDMPSTMITPMLPISASFIPGLTKQRKVIAAKPSASISPIASTTKVVPVGPSSLISASLPGLTITPVNVYTTSRPENKCDRQDNLTKISSIADILTSFKNPEAVDFSNVYFNTLSNRPGEDMKFDCNKIVPENIFSTRPSLSTVAPRNETIISPMEEGKR